MHTYTGKYVIALRSKKCMKRRVLVSAANPLSSICITSYGHNIIIYIVIYIIIYIEKSASVSSK